MIREVLMTAEEYVKLKKDLWDGLFQERLN